MSDKQCSAASYQGLHCLLGLGEAVLTSTTIYALSRNRKTTRIVHLKVFIFLVVKFSIYLNRLVFVIIICLSSFFYCCLGSTCPGVSLTLCCFVVYSTRRFILCFTLCYFVLVFFSPFSTEITSLGEERANLSVFRTFFRFVLVWFCRFSLPLGVWEGLQFVIVAFPGLSLTFLCFMSVVFPDYLHLYFCSGLQCVVDLLLLWLPIRLAQ